MSWLPSDLSNLRQWALDQRQGSGEPYEASLVDGKPALRALEAYDSLRAPRGQRCYLFDGMNDDCIIPRTTRFDTDVFSITAWINGNALNNYRTVMRAQNTAGAGLFVQDQKAILLDSVLKMQGTTTLATGQWYFLAATIGGGELDLYINAMPDAATVADTMDFTIQGDPTIGAGSVSGNKWSGFVRDVRFYDKKLAADEVQFLFDGAGNDPGLLNLVGRWNCNEETGLIAYDASGNGNHGSLTNITQSTFHAVDSTPTNPANELGHTNRRNLLPHTTDICNGLQGAYNGWNWNAASTVTPGVADPDGGNEAFTIQPGVLEFSAYIRQNLFTEPWIMQAAANDRLLFTAKASTPVNLVVDSSGTPKAAIGTDWTDIDVTLSAGNVTLGGFGSWAGGEAITFYNLRWVRAAQTDDSYQEITAGIAAEGIVPRDESSPANDVLGDPLQYPGQCPYPVRVQTQCGTWTGSIDYLSVPHLTGAESVTKFEGTATPTISAGRIDFTAGTAALLILSDGSHFTFDSGAGLTIWNADGSGNHASLVNVSQITFWGARTDSSKDHCLEYGGRTYLATTSQGTGGFVDNAIICDPLLTDGDVVEFFPPPISNSPIFGITYHTIAADVTFNNNPLTIQRASASTYSAFSNTMTPTSLVFPRDLVASDRIGMRASGADIVVTLNGADVQTYAGALSGGSARATIVASGVGQTMSVDAIANRSTVWDVANYGATAAFVPGLLDGSSAADGNPITLLAKQHGNPHSRRVEDPWLAPRLAPLALPAERAPGVLLRVPGEQLFVSEENAQPGILGTPFADGDNRLFNVDATLSGADLDAAIEYIKRAEVPIPPTFLAAWARERNRIIQAPVMP